MIDIELYSFYLIIGIFISWFLIYINLPDPQIYEFEKFNNNRNKKNCF